MGFVGEVNSVPWRFLGWAEAGNEKASPDLSYSWPSLAAQCYLPQMLTFQGTCFRCDCANHSQHYCWLQQCAVCHHFGHSERVCGSGVGAAQMAGLSSVSSAPKAATVTPRPKKRYPTQAGSDPSLPPPRGPPHSATGTATGSYSSQSSSWSRTTPPPTFSSMAKAPRSVLASSSTWILPPLSSTSANSSSSSQGKSRSSPWTPGGRRDMTQDGAGATNSSWRRRDNPSSAGPSSPSRTISRPFSAAETPRTALTPTAPSSYRSDPSPGRRGK